MVERKLYRIHIFSVIAVISIEVLRIIYPITLLTFIKKSLKIDLQVLLLIFIATGFGLLGSLSNQSYTPFLDSIKLNLGILTYVLFYSLYIYTDVNKIIAFVLLFLTLGMLIEQYFMGVTRTSFLFYEPGYVAPLICLGILTSFFTNADFHSRLLTVLCCGALVFFTVSLFAFGFFVAGMFLLFPIFSILVVSCVVISLPFLEHLVVVDRVLEVISASSVYDFFHLMGNRLPRMIAAYENLEFTFIPPGLDSYYFVEAGRKLPMVGMFFELSYILGAIPSCLIVLYLLHICFRSVVATKKIGLLLMYFVLFFYLAFESIVFKYYIWACFGVISAAKLKRVAYE